MFIRVVQLALFFAIMIPFAMGVKWSVGFLDQRGLDIATGIIIGMAISLALQSWDERLRRRAGTRTETDL
jgi:putative effector of murein hydrolase LrgA (UPF0299 family)